MPSLMNKAVANDFIQSWLTCSSGPVNEILDGRSSNDGTTRGYIERIERNKSARFHDIVQW